MKRLHWKEIIEMIGMLAIIVSLIFLALQVKQERTLMWAEMRAAMVSNQIAVNEMIIENADLWRRGNAGEELDEIESIIFRRLVHNVNEHYFHLTYTFTDMAPEQKETVIAIFAGFLFDHPGAYRVWREREDRLHFYRTAIDANERLTQDWIEAIEVRLNMLRQVKAASP